MKISIIIQFLFICNIATIAFALKCLDCNEYNPDCTKLVVNYNRTGIETCNNSRCFIREVASWNNITVRGCDSRYWYPSHLTIPDNGCAIFNNERWCWCNNDELCNMFDFSILSALNGGFDTCQISPCKNNGTCQRQGFTGGYTCKCPDKYYGKNCENTDAKNG